MKQFIMVLTVFVALTACQKQQKQEEKSQAENMDVKAEDVHTYAKPEESRMTHLSWEANVNFDQKKIEGVAHIMLQNAPDAHQVILDTKDLTIKNVTTGPKENEQQAKFELSPDQPFMGRALSIEITPDTKQVNVFYTTSPDAAALQWLSPQQTADKTDPYLFTQSEAILARTWIPLQDSPGIRFSYDADVTVPKGMLALMSAKNPQEVDSTGHYHFEMPQPIPAYLMALAVGKLSFMPLSENTGVYAEPSVVKQAHWEFKDMPKMLAAAEKLYGPYRWGRYDVLVLPPSFPFGGMENPRLTFATPTILAGDRSLVSLIAHEMAHSWSGNLVTNATWNDFWLNEGFTVYFEQRIMEALYGRSYSEMLASLNKQDLKEEIAHMVKEGHAADTKLKLNLKGRNPDDGMTNIAYDKGYLFLRLLEEKVGREKWDAFLKKYFADNAFHSMDTEGFITYLNQNLFAKNNIPVDESLYQSWVYGEGLPENAPEIHSERFDKVDQQREAWLNGGDLAKLDTTNWTTHEWLHFLRGLPADLSSAQITALDNQFHFTDSGNSEILDVWFVLAVRHHYKPAYANMEDFLIHTGRRKFLTPLYGEMLKTPEGTQMAKSIYAKARPNYHYVSTNTLDAMMEKADNQ